MLTIPRIKRFIKALEMDDDEILGDEKDNVLQSLLLVGRRYSAYYRLCSNDALIEHLKTLFVKRLPAEIYNEAIDIITEAIDEDSRENGLPIALYRDSDRRFIYGVVLDHEKDSHNLQVVEYVFGEKRYIAPANKPKKKKRRKSVLKDEDWAQGDLTEEEGLDEIDPI